MPDKEKPLKLLSVADINCLKKYKEYWLKEKNPQRLINAINYCKSESIIMPTWLQIKIMNSFSESTFNGRGEFILGRPFTRKDYKKQNILKNQIQQLIAGVYAECLDAGLNKKEALELTQYELHYSYNKEIYDEDTIKRYYRSSLLHRLRMTNILDNMFLMFNLTFEPIGHVVCGNKEWKNNTIKRRLYFYKYILENDYLLEMPESGKNSEAPSKAHKHLIFNYITKETVSYLYKTIPSSVSYMFKIANAKVEELE